MREKEQSMKYVDFSLYSYLPGETDRTQTWNQLRRSPRTASPRLRCKDTVPKAISSCHLWRTTSLPGIPRPRSTVIRCITPEAVHILDQGAWQNNITIFSHISFFTHIRVMSVEEWMDLEVTRPILYHRRRVARRLQRLNVAKVVPVQRCNSASKLLEFLLHLPYPVLYEGISFFSRILMKKTNVYVCMYTYISMLISGERNVFWLYYISTCTYDTKTDRFKCLIFFLIIVFYWLSWNIRIIHIHNFTYVLFQLYICIFRDIFHIAQNLSQRREQEGSATHTHTH